MVATATDSFRVILSSHEPQIGESPAKKSLRCFNDLLECGDNKEAIKEVSSKLGKRVLKKYKQFLNIIYRNNAIIRMYDNSASQDLRPQKITSELTRKIYDVIDEVENVPELSSTNSGVLMGVDFTSCELLHAKAVKLPTSSNIYRILRWA